jgi:hypothetical protein
MSRVILKYYIGGMGLIAATNSLFNYCCKQPFTALDFITPIIWPISIPVIIGLELDTMIFGSRWEISIQRNTTKITYKQ